MNRIYGGFATLSFVASALAMHLKSLEYAGWFMLAAVYFAIWQLIVVVSRKAN